MMSNDDKMITEDASESKQPDDKGNIVVEELLRIFDPITKQDYVIRKF
jgi:hypothetical protein